MWQRLWERVDMYSIIVEKSKWPLCIALSVMTLDFQMLVVSWVDTSETIFIILYRQVGKVSQTLHGAFNINDVILPKIQRGQ